MHKSIAMKKNAWWGRRLPLAALLWACNISSAIAGMPGTPIKGAMSLPGGAWVAIALITLFIGWFLYAFTSIFPGEDWEKRTKGKGVVWERRNKMVSFAYIFTIAVLLLPVWSYLNVQHARPSITTDLNNQPVRDFPFEVTIGCAEPPVKDASAKAPEKDLESVPLELRCGSSSGQWVVNIGGTQTRASLDQASVPKPVNPGDASKLQGSKQQNDDRSPEAGISKIHGGLVVPLYFVILSLMGAAVSLARRVPEIQRQSEHDYVGTENAPKLLPGEMRERLAFQILQFVSAPLIAITAYHAIRPESRMASVALAFVAGFASESILLMIRGVVDGIKPQTTAKAAPKGTASGVIVDASNQPVADAAISVIGQPGLKTKSNLHGLFVIAAIGVGEHVVEASNASGQSANQKIEIKAGATSTCRIELQ